MAFNHVGTKHSCTIGEVEKDHGDEVRSLITELAAATATEFGVNFEPGVQDRSYAYARSVAHYPTGIKEFPHRNGFYWERTLKAQEAGKPDPTPIHSELLRATGSV